MPVLAEHAADDAALAVSFDSQAYARLLLDTAARVDTARRSIDLAFCRDERTRGRTAHPARAGHACDGAAQAAGQDRLGDARGCWSIVLIWISTAVDIPRLVAGQANDPAGAKEFPFQMTAEQVAALEQELATNPENEAVRERLLVYYTVNEFCAQAIRGGLPTAPECRDRDVQTASRRTQLILWLIDHHPESDLNKMAMILPQLDGPNVYEDARNRWLTQVNLHPNDARVLLNASGILGDYNGKSRSICCNAPGNSIPRSGRSRSPGSIPRSCYRATNPVSRRRSETSCRVRTILHWLDRWPGTWSKVGLPS